MRAPVSLPRSLLAAAAVLALGAMAALGVTGLHRAALSREMLALPPDAVVANPSLQRFAAAQGASLYAANCAGCHGAKLEGNPAIGAPSLAEPHWLYGAGRVFDIERTILFGIRSGYGKARNEAEMPAFGQAGLLAPAEVTKIVDYLRTLHDHTADLSAGEGRSLYLGKGGCADCHGPDARGSTDYGAPDLTTGRFNHGGSQKSLYASIFYGLHEICPAWQGRLTLAQIRALAVYVYSASHGPAKS